MCVDKDGNRIDIGSVISIDGKYFKVVNHNNTVVLFVDDGKVIYAPSFKVKLEERNEQLLNHPPHIVR